MPPRRTPGADPEGVLRADFEGVLKGTEASPCLSCGLALASMCSDLVKLSRILLTVDRK